jgi:hypothetical protein
MIRWLCRLPATAVPWTDPEAVRFTRSTIADLRARCDCKASRPVASLPPGSPNPSPGSILALGVLRGVYGQGWVRPGTASPQGSYGHPTEPPPCTCTV